MVGTADAHPDTDPGLYGHAPKAFDYDSDLSGLSALVAVHAEDPHIPLVRARHSAAVLRTLGAEVTEQVYPGPGHAILPDAIAVMRHHLGA